jgi:uncharacterized membrane protein
VIRGQETPTPIDNLFDLSTSSAVVVLLAFTLVLLAAMMLAWAIIAASKRPPPTSMVVSLALLSLFAIAGGIATRSESAWAVAAAGVGALAGSVVSMFQGGPQHFREESAKPTLLENPLDIMQPPPEGPEDDAHA